MNYGSVKVQEHDNTDEFEENLRKLVTQKVYVGIPASGPEERRAVIEDLLTRMPTGSKAANKRRKRLVDMVAMSVTNAELLFIHTNGSELRNIPARPVIEPAIEDNENKAAILAEMQSAADAGLSGQDPTVYFKRAGFAAQRAAQNWFTNPKNHWAPNSPFTIKEKGSDKPLIDTGAMRAAITFVVTDRE